MSPDQPQSPNPDFGFLNDSKQPAKRRLALPQFSKPVKIALMVLGTITLLIIIASVLSGRSSGKNQPYINVLSRQTEILRVTTLAQQQLHLQDSQTQALAATATAALQSDQARLVDYLAKNHTKVNAKLLTGDLDKSADASLQAASENNGLDAAYAAYLKDALAKYQNELQIAYKTAGPNGKKILSDAFDSAKTLLSAPQLN